MKKGIFVSLLLAAVTVVGTAQTSHALPLLDSFTSTLFSRIGETENQTQNETNQTDNAASEKQAELDAKRQEIEQKLAERRAAIAEKLSGKRAEQCEKKEATINRVLDDRVSAAQRHLDKFKVIQDKLVAFVADKQLDVQNASALEVIMNDKQQNAQAAIDTIATVDFSCANADATSPGAIVMDEVASVKQALKDYRTAIKDYAISVKNSVTPPSSDDTNSSNSTGTTENETENQESAQ